MKEQEWDQSGVGNVAEHKQCFGFVDFIIHDIIQIEMSMVLCK
jgi:hypothetical protein